MKNLEEKSGIIIRADEKRISATYNLVGNYFERKQQRIRSFQYFTKSIIQKIYRRNIKVLISFELPEEVA